jgi:hypothetical protein
MGQFVRCRGKAYCLETPAGCRSCGRSHEEIATTRSLIGRAARFVLEQDYENPGAFAYYLAEKVAKKVEHARSQE